MHVRWSQVRGMPVLDDETQEIVGFLTDPLINPDTGRILGFFVASPRGSAFLSVPDICSWGTKVHVRCAEKLSPPEELIRMRSHFDDPRSFLGQPLRVRGSNRTLGKCGDLQFDTRHFAVEWLFPRGLLFYRQPVAAADIVEVTEEAIWIEDPLKAVKEKAEPKIVADTPTILMPEITTTVQGRSSELKIEN